MSRLISPGYSRSAIISASQQVERMLNFGGLNRQAVVNEGEMSDMKNLTADEYPVLCPRKLRGQMTIPDGITPLKVITKFERIAMIARKSDQSIAFYYGKPGELSEVPSVTGLSADTEMVAINTKICFFPQKMYLSLIRNGDSVTVGAFGHLGYSKQVTNAVLTPSNADVELDLGSAHEFVAGDAIDIVGKYASPIPTTPEVLRYFMAHGYDVNVSCTIKSVEGTKIFLPRESFIELTGEGVTRILYSGSISRGVPDVKHVIEYNNRLWGVSDSDNTIYACKLGDPLNWKYYQGTSLDSYYATQGTDESWTGSAVYSGHLIFFKPNSITRIYGTSPASFQVVASDAYGVEKGSEHSVVNINNTVFYKSSIGIMAYDGGTPYCISNKLNCEIKSAVGGTEGKKYYVSYHNADTDKDELMVLDIEKSTWHKEDDVRFRDCCTLDGSLYFISDTATDDVDKDGVYIINPDAPNERLYDRDWMGVFGPFDESIDDMKIYSRITLRLIADKGSKVTVYIKEDDHEWERIKSIAWAETGGHTIQVPPRRCDRFSIKIVGKGECKIKSMTRRYKVGGKAK